MWLMLQQETAEDYVIATGEQYSVRQFVELAASHFGFELEWHSNGVDEVALDKNTKKTIIAVDPKYFRPAEVDTLLGDPKKAKEKLGWVPEITAQEMCAEMVREDLKAAKRQALLKEHQMSLPISIEN